MKKISILMLLLCCATFGYSQVRITGRVTDTESEPLVGITIIVQGTQNGTITDSNGRYSIVASKNDVLEFSYIGMMTKEVEVQNQTTLDIEMLNDTYSFDEVVVIGYGTSKKSDLAGSISSIKSADLKAQKIGTVSSAIQGMAAGVQVTQGNMKPGADAGIVIRGAGSINAGTAPLIVIDGMPGGSLQDVAPEDVASIEVLKDASSASIYGSRGSNGVILISTRRGAKNQSRVSFNASAGVQQFTNKQNLCNAAQYYDLIETTGMPYTWTAEELRMLSRGESTDWQDAVMQNGTYQNYSISVSKGGEDFSNYLGVDFYDQNGIMKGSQYNRLSARYNADWRVSDFASVGARFNIIESNLTNSNEEEDSLYGTMFSAISSQPTAPIYNSMTGEYFDEFLNTKANPVAMVDLLDKNTNKTNLTGSFYLEIEPIKNLKIRSDNGGSMSIFRVNEYEDGRMGQHYPNEGHAVIKSNKRRYWQSENTITYSFERNKHKVTAMGGFSASKVEFEQVIAEALGLNSTTKYNNLGGASDWGPNKSNANASTLTSTYLRGTYNYDERYLATFTMRADGSSKFAPGKRWGYFPSLALAWRVTQEEFMNSLPALNNLKLRVSIGQLGNQNIGDYAYVAKVVEGGQYSNYIFGDNLATGAVYSSIENPNLTWEKANQADIGIDFGFFDNAIAGSIDAYYKRTSDLLWTVPLPIESGYLTSLTNVGVLDNKGIEFSLNTVNVNTANFRWTSAFNITYNRNEIVELYDGKTQVNNSLFVGHSLGEFYKIQSDGIWQLDEAVEAAKYNCVPGDRRMIDKTKDDVINGEDRTFCGQRTPTYYGGFTNTLKWHNLDFILHITYAGGHLKENTLNRFLGAYNPKGNTSVEFYENYWRPDRPSEIYPAPRDGSPYMNGDGTDVNLQSGAYLRVKNIELGYTIPKSTLKVINSVRLSFAVQNIYTLTEYDGYDVESSDPSNPYPCAIGFIGGLSVKF